VWLALVLYVAAIGLLHAVIKKGQREYVALAKRLAEVTEPIAGPPPEVARIEALERRISLGWGFFNVIVIAVVVLMVWRPGA
jgi:hypothetical protein